MAADSVAWKDDIHIPTLPKIKRQEDGTLIACTGDVAVTRWFMEAWPNIRNDDAPKVERDEFTALIVTPDGQCFECDHHMRPYKVIGPYHALGAPVKFMLGALATGASAERAVRLALEHTDGGAGEVQVEHLHPALSEAAE